MSMIKKTKKWYVSPEEKPEIIDGLRLKSYNDGISEITKVSKNSQQNNSENVTNENDKEIPKERHICPEERQKAIDINIIILVLI